MILDMSLISQAFRNTLQNIFSGLEGWLSGKKHLLHTCKDQSLGPRTYMTRWTLSSSCLCILGSRYRTIIDLAGVSQKMWAPGSARNWTLTHLHLLWPLWRQTHLHRHVHLYTYMCIYRIHILYLHFSDHLIVGCLFLQSLFIYLFIFFV